MRCITIMDGRFVTVNGEPASSHMDYESFARHFLTNFDEIVIVGRLFDSTEANARPVCGPNVRFLALPAYSGPEAFVTALPRIIKIFLDLLKDDKAAFLLRIPGGVSSIFSLLAALKGRSFAIECTADTADQLSKGAVRHPLRRFFQWLSIKIVRWQCRKALVSTYVTHKALQSRYPPGRPEHSHYWTDIVLSDDTYVEASRPVETFNAMTPVLLNIGMMFQLYKGQDTLLQAARICKDAGVEVQIRFVGDGPYRKFLTEMTESLDLTDNVTFVGKLLGGKPVRDEIDAADVFVMPSRQEGLPRALLEAMARGAPCITSDVGGIPELMSAEDMIPANAPAALAEKLLALTRTPENTARKSARNLERARDYHYEIVRHRRAAFYKDLSTLARD